ncbi:MAG TPA: hypothetical protein P5275_15925 [Saprospiraceae bacterium]|nr:hypothetical protein [Saprospiraceae bacterium]MCB9268215.1 hypothetical protein [Lewinellaceae bacterium]HPG06349.1 hypothetical protein [Saprospiraceae bacterium]HPR02026.1 hypothetical protein [Saprospiraceae bacterium]HRV86363.1 hypothetical protein [Saprospiraceae bacterium]
MKQDLQRYHRRIWIALALIVPVLIGLAVMVIPPPVIQDKLFQPPAKDHVLPDQNSETPPKIQNG